MTTIVHVTGGIGARRRPAPKRAWPCAPFPVRSERDHKQAIAILDQLVPLDRPNREERDFMDIMLPVVEVYETQRQHGIDTSRLTPVELIRSLLKDHQMSAADLGRLLGNRSLGSAILSGKRELSKTHIRILSERFKISPAAFI